MRRYLYIAFLILTSVLGFPGGGRGAAQDPGRDFYKILEIPRSADQKQIKKAHRNGVKKWHPDKNPDNQEAAQKKFLSISDAYEVLSDAEKKGKYDRCGEPCVSGEETIQSNYNTHGNFHRQRRQTFVQTPAPHSFRRLDQMGKDIMKSLYRELRGDETLETKIGEGWPLLLYVYNGSNFNPNLDISVAKDAGISAYCLPLFTQNLSIFGIVQESNVEEVKLILNSDKKFMKAAKRLSPDAQLHHLVMLTMEDNGIKVIDSISPHADADQLRNWIRKHTPQPITKLRTVKDFYKFIHGCSPKPKIILFEKHRDPLLNRMALSHTYADYALVKLNKNQLPKQLKSVLQPPARQPYTATHIYDVTLSSDKYSKGLGIEQLGSYSAGGIFIDKARKIAKEKIKGVGLHQHVGHVKMVTKDCQIDYEFCGPRDRHICVLYVGRKAPEELKKMSVNYSKEKSLRFGLISEEDIKKIIPETKKSQYVVVKPRVGIYKVMGPEESIENFVRNIVDFEFTISSSGVSKLNTDFDLS